MEVWCKATTKKPFPPQRTLRKQLMSMERKFVPEVHFTRFQKSAWIYYTQREECVGDVLALVVAVAMVRRVPADCET